MRLSKLKTLTARLSVGLLTFAAGVTWFLVWQYDRPSHAPKAAEQVQAARPAAEPDSAKDDAAARTPRGPMAGVDFDNFTYPSPSAGKRVTVRDGRLEYPTEPGCGQSFRVLGVRYVDFDGDGEDEALVRLSDHAACGSSVTSVNYFVYAARRGRPHLLWSFATGSEAYGGEKDFRVEGTELVFELYGKWVGAGDGVKFKLEKMKGFSMYCDRCTDHYAVYRVAWDGRKFRRKSLEDFTCPEGCMK